MKLIKLISISLCLMLLFAACSNDKKPDDKQSSFKPVIKFKDCDPYDCGTMEVPMDYRNIDGRKIKIELIRKPAENKKQKLGVLLVNPGGPGASGMNIVRDSASAVFPPEILERFDIIGWDPRGAGKSSKVTCDTNLDFLFEGVDYSPDNEAEREKLVEVNTLLGEKCEEEDAELLKFLDTESSVRDMDEMRKALGEDEINFLGFSYGSSLGQIYATLFPDNFRTMVIDGIIDLAETAKETSAEQVRGFENSIGNFFDYCRRQSCSYSQGQDPETKYLEIMQKIDQNPIASPNERNFTLGPAQLDLATSYFLYSGEVGWKNLDAALNDVNRGFPSKLLVGFSAYAGRSVGGQYDGSYSSFLTIGCADGYTAKPQGMFDLAETMVQEAPIFGMSGVLLGMPCSTWPSNSAAETFKVKTSKSKPILVIGTVGDPATPVTWARSAAKQISNSAYLEVDGDTHTSFAQGNTCVDELVVKYFLSAKSPGDQKC